MNQVLDFIKKYTNYVAELILKVFADDDKKMILDATLDKPRTPVGILDVCKIPPTSGYRKIKSLVREGLLIPNGTNCHLHVSPTICHIKCWVVYVHPSS